MAKFQLFALVALCAALLFVGVSHGAACYAANCAKCADSSSILCETSSCKPYFYNLLGACVPCPLNCKSCTSSLACDTGACDAGYTLKYGVCLKDPESTPSTGACYNGACLACESGSLWKCAADGCKPYFYNFGGACVPCPLNCQSCADFLTCHAGSCDEGYMLKLGMCVRSSPSASSRVSLGVAVVTVLALLLAH